LIAGIDEVGRGSLAGPVVACAIIMRPGERAIAGVDDSKMLTAGERRRLARLIRTRALCIALGAASAREIDRINVYQATALAMRRALRRLTMRPDHILLDGLPMRALEIEHTAVVGGDGRCFHIACASIIAKVTRDRLLTALSLRHPAYAWDRNAGYGTPQHVSALRDAGFTAHHRRSFVVQGLEGDLPVAAPREAPDAARGPA
jgi:ribonuclease HII